MNIDMHTKTKTVDITLENEEDIQFFIDLLHDALDFNLDEKTIEKAKIMLDILAEL